MDRDLEYYRRSLADIRKNPAGCTNEGLQLMLLVLIAELLLELLIEV